jgi:hypothetical protein
MDASLLAVEQWRGGAGNFDRNYRDEQVLTK